MLRRIGGGDGRGRMNLSGRSTAISKEYLPRQYQFFDTNTVQEENAWRINGMPENIAPGSRRLLTWHDCDASTSRVVLPSQFEAPSGFFTADLEIFILSGAIQIGEWQLNKHSYSFIPAGVKTENGKTLRLSRNSGSYLIHDPKLESCPTVWIEFQRRYRRWLRCRFSPVRSE